MTLQREGVARGALGALLGQKMSGGRYRAKKLFTRIKNFFLKVGIPFNKLLATPLLQQKISLITLVLKCCLKEMKQTFVLI
jgi:hypothetical protein